MLTLGELTGACLCDVLLCDHLLRGLLSTFLVASVYNDY